MKLIRGTVYYRGCQFDMRGCFKTIKEAAFRLGRSVYEINTYFFKDEIKEPFEGIFVIAYSHKAKEAIGHTNEILLEEAKNIVDEYFKTKY